MILTKEELAIFGDLTGIVAVGYNAYGGGFDNLGHFTFQTEDEAISFANDAPVSRDIIFLR